MTSSKSNYLPEASYPNVITFEDKDSRYEIEGRTKVFSASGGKSD